MATFPKQLFQELNELDKMDTGIVEDALIYGEKT